MTRVADRGNFVSADKVMGNSILISRLIQEISFKFYIFVRNWTLNGCSYNGSVTSCRMSSEIISNNLKINRLVASLHLWFWDSFFFQVKITPRKTYDYCYYYLMKLNTFYYCYLIKVIFLQKTYVLLLSFNENCIQISTGNNLKKKGKKKHK